MEEWMCDGRVVFWRDGECCCQDGGKLYAGKWNVMHGTKGKWLELRVMHGFLLVGEGMHGFIREMGENGAEI
ncbi:AP-1 complex subunit sigma-1-like [Pyrus ussuriensis x Pyrus communis]|uniref:AP-1 complex subunit sigma-1-like n=1 Tax=Pyrus ussuriensis x Pyrus communis TaxID=2448454 RepID=A0A5N5FTP9_9ROSA|nr:AP-1 complex subunit sigma-1-like [Pyrus ussuriensis x Pyrus communis]